MTKTQKILFDYLVKTFNPTSVEEYVYSGPRIGSDLLVYDAKIIYFGLQFSITEGDYYLSTSPSHSELYDEANVIKTVYFNNLPVYDSGASNTQYSRQPDFLENVYFNRCVSTKDYFNFIGFKLTLP